MKPDFHNKSNSVFTLSWNSENNVPPIKTDHKDKKKKKKINFSEGENCQNET